MIFSYRLFHIIHSIWCSIASLKMSPIFWDCIWLFLHWWICTISFSSCLLPYSIPRIKTLNPLIAFKRKERICQVISKVFWILLYQPSYNLKHVIILARIILAADFLLGFTSCCWFERKSMLLVMCNKFSLWANKGSIRNNFTAVYYNSLGGSILWAFPHRIKFFITYSLKKVTSVQ